LRNPLQEKQNTIRRIAMKTGKWFVVAATMAALVLGMFIPLNASANDKVYELKFAWNDIWGPKFRASQVYRPCG